MINKTKTRKDRDAIDDLMNMMETGVFKKGKVPVNYQSEEALKNAIAFMETALQSLKKAKGLISVDMEFIPTPNGTRILTGNLIFEVVPGLDHGESDER